MASGHGSVFPRNEVRVGDFFYRTDQQRLYMFAGGGLASTAANWIEISNDGTYTKFQILAADPDTSSWGSSEQGYMWYNSTDQQLKQWDGGKVVLAA